MGVDASYVYGYMADVEEIEWDISYLKGKFNLKEKVEGWLGKYYTYGDIIEKLEKDEVEDWDDLEALGFKCAVVDDEVYLYFTHFELIKQYPDRKLEELEELAKEHAKLSGIKNYEVFSWDEFGYFS